MLFTNKHTNRCLLLTALSLFLGLSLPAQNKPSAAGIAQKVNNLLAKMTLEEKIGQLNQYASYKNATGPISNTGNMVDEIKQGRVGSILKVNGAVDTRIYQQAAMQSRLKIPLLFGEDVIHGYRTTFPIPLAEAASWDMDAIRLSARIAATEAAASGIHWTFAPMVDISRDPRWGRVMEGAGEDPYLGSQIAIARVKGFQGDGLGSLDAVMACAKHFAAYGAAIAGRDYNAVDMSDRMLWEVYLPPFKAALDAGAATFMNSFNELNGIPATGNSYLQRKVLKGKWGFKGFVVSDWGSIAEMVNHGFVKDKNEAARVALNAGSDMDMEGRSYIEYLPQLVRSGKVSITLVDDAVRRVLTKKFELGLFDDPYRFSDEKREKEIVNSPRNHEVAKMMAQKSIVLLKNEGELLPLSRNAKSIAVIGPLAKAKKDMNGFWALPWGIADESEPVSLFEGIQAKVGDKKNVWYAKGCNVNDTSRAGFAEAARVAQNADVVVMAIGEAYNMSGEAKSRANIHLPGVQEELVKAIQATGKPTVVLVMGGRPLIFNWTADHVPAILFTWWLGVEGGNAMADVLFGDYNPSAKLPITFPRSEGQIPVYYASKNTGRPLVDVNDVAYKSAYIDELNTPRFAFGYGLSYTHFKYSDLKLSSKKINNTQTITCSFTITNSGKYTGEEVVQLYLRNRVASVTRPVKELKDFKKIKLMPSESKTVSFVIDKQKLCFYNQSMQWGTEPGMFDVMIGSASNDIRLSDDFELLK
ncbi:glycoside hydrolase family 3 N-terminal domain-containing protein [Mucilaginibacter paludis]|uniref:Glycoside hydrolase family 3 domain protein n=1 Tax=Mucilaginibacter paludis DSM 18603 TaxID=714943 RepID=H1YIE4_9SPHI|nr:glycoside hydrolase family 3 N-terminal domain-containing protein [Mucilaginibacter paludis]EHQ27557.1 glycoside hydrolase family 3 domain protein [Mucilaginibacter paludis DSM 18603]